MGRRALSLVQQHYGRQAGASPAADRQVDSSFLTLHSALVNASRRHPFLSPSSSRNPHLTEINQTENNQDLSPLTYPSHQHHQQQHQQQQQQQHVTRLLHPDAISLEETGFLLKTPGV